MTDVICPLSGSRDVTLLQTLDVAQIAAMYQRIYGFDPRSEFGDVREIGFYRSNLTDLRFFWPQTPGGQTLYERLQQTDWYYLEDKPEYAFAAPYVQPTDRVLEIGSGNGAFAGKIASENYLGLEFSDNAIALAAKKGIHLINETIEHHAISHVGEYDVVCGFQVLEHVPDIGAFLAASAACVRPGGLLLFSVPSADGFMGATTNNVLNMPPHHMSWWTYPAFDWVEEHFGLNLIAREHERLAEAHRQAYLKAVILRGWNASGAVAPLLDTSARWNLQSKAAGLLARVLRRGLSDAALQPGGHSITAVYRKPQ